MKIIVEETQRVVVLVDGRVRTVLGPGRHSLADLPWRPGRWRVERVDVRRRLLVVAGQEVSCGDVPGVRVTLALTFAVDDPVVHLQASADPLDELRTEAQLALRDALATRAVERLTAERDTLADELRAAIAPAAVRVGIRLERAQLRDVVLPGEVRRALLAVQTARLEGQAALERARGEVAALRALANGARVLADHPGLLQLRTAEVVGASGGTVVLHGGDPVAAAGA